MGVGRIVRLMRLGNPICSPHLRIPTAMRGPAWIMAIAPRTRELNPIARVGEYERNPAPMPQASQEVTDAMRELFGELANDYDALAYLISLGYYEKAGLFTVPAKAWVQDRKLRVALQYLQDEWDYGWEWDGPAP